MNDNETDRQDGTLGRRISVRAFGDTADEIELYALDEARLVFGADVPLEIVRDYQINPIYSGSSLTAFADGKTRVATVIVRERAGS